MSYESQSSLDTHAVAGTIQPVVVGDRDYALVRHARGWSLLPDRCTHSGCAFSKFGEVVDGDVLICNCHGAEFDVVTGEVLMGPAQSALDVIAVTPGEGGFDLLNQPLSAVERPADNSASATLSADFSLCKGYANCVVAADDYLDLDDEGMVVLLRVDVPKSDQVRVEEAARSCPVSALRLDVKA